MIELNQVTKRYGQASVLKNITLTIDEPGIYCLLGRNGAARRRSSSLSRGIRILPQAASRSTARR